MPILSPLTVTIPEAENKVNSTERINGVQVYVGLPEGAAVNDKIWITVTLPNATQLDVLRILTEEDVAAHECVMTIPSTRITTDGIYNLSVTLENAAKEFTTATLAQFELDKTAPSAPAAPTTYLDDIGSIQDPVSKAAVTDDAKPGINIAKNLTDTPKLYVDGKLVDASYDPAAGTITPKEALADGLHSFQVSLTDAAGNESFKSAALKITIDTAAPATPAAPANYNDDVGSYKHLSSVAATTDDNKPGINVPKSLTDKVNLYVDGVKVDAAYDATAGTLTPTGAVSDGLHTFAYSLSDVAGNESAKSGTLSITIDTTAPAVPTGMVATDDVGAVTGAITAGSTTDDTKPTFSGTGTAGDLIRIYDGATVIGSVTVGAGGTWSFTPTTALPEGSHPITTTASDPLGNESAKSAALTFTVDTTAPAAPTTAPTSYKDDVGATTSLTSTAASTDDNKPGINVPKSLTDKVNLYVDGVKVDAAYDATAGTLTPTGAVSDGLHTFAYSLSDVAGNESAKSGTLSITIDTTAPAVPTGMVATDDVGAVTGAITAGSTTDDTKPTFSGTGTAGDLIRIYDGATVIGSVTVGAGGTWSFTPTTALPEGSHPITTTATDPSGNQSAKSAALTFTVDTTAPAAPTTAPTSYKDDVGATTSLTSTAASTDDNKPGINVPKSLTDKVNLYVDGVKVDAAYDATAGTLTPTGAVSDGLHTFAYSLSDVAGNESAKSGTLSITIDTTAPAVPTGMVATDDVGAVTGAITAGSTTDDTKPTFSGTGTAGDLIRIYDGATVIGSVTVGAGGTWSFTPTTALPEGSHPITTTATDPSGNQSAKSAALTFTVDTTAPLAPNLSLQSDSGSSPTDGVTNVATINVNGLEAGATWEYQVDSGVWTKGTGSSFAATSGTHTYAVRQSDAAGNLGTASAVTSITLDTTGPALSMNLRTDSGSSTDFVTNDPVVMVNNLEAGRPWQYSLDGGTTWLDGYGNSFTLNNLLANGDFSAGNVGFTTESSVKVLSTPPMWNLGFTSGVGGDGDNFLLVDGANAATKAAWAQNVALVQGVTYTFSYYAAGNWNAPNLQFYVNGVAVGASNQLAVSAKWTQVSVTFTATTTGVQQLAIKDLVTLADGNDFGLDSLSLTPVGANLAYVAGQVKVRQSDLAGNETTIGNAQAWTVDTTAPVAPTTAPASYKDDVGAVQNAASVAASTDDNKPGINVGKNLVDTPTLYVDGSKVDATYDAANGTLTPVGAVADGLRKFTHTLTDKAGNESGQSPALNITIDTTAPNTPAVVVATDDVGTITGAIVGGSTTDDTKPTFSGTGTAGDLIRIYDGATVIGSVTVGAGGTWSFTPTTALPEGSHPITTTATDALGNESAKSAALTFTVDTTAPAAPTTAPTSYKDDVGATTSLTSTAASTDDNKPGINVPKSLTDKVNLYVDGVKVDAAYDATAGTLTPTGAVSDGLHTFAYSLSDVAGNESAKSGTLSITIDTTAPAVPTGMVATDDVGAVTGAITAGSTTDDTKPTFSGTGTAGDLIRIYDGATVIGSVTVGAGGTWSFTPTTALPEGSHPITTTASDPLGNESAKSAALTFTVDTTAPAAPTTAPTSYKDDVGATTSLTSTAASTDDNKPGINVPKSLTDKVNLYVDGVKVDAAYDATAGTLTPTGAVSDGLHTFAYSLSDVAGNESAKSGTLSITIDTTAPAVPTGMVATDDVGAVTGAITAGSTTDDTKPTFSGTGTAGDLIRIYDGATVIGSVTVGAGGTWSFTPTTALPEGSHPITTTATDPSGNQSAKSAALTFTVDTTAPAAPTTAPTSYKDDVGATTSLTSTAASTDDNKPGINVPKSLTDKVNLYVDGVKVDAAYDATAGTLTPTGAVSDGLHTFAYSLSDVAGNESAKSGTLSITIDTTAPAVPTGMVATDDVGAVTGAITAGSTTDDTKPTFSGTGTAGDLIRIYDGATVIGSVTVGAGGTWSFTPTTALPEGSHPITTTATDALGNESAKSAALTFTVDTTAPLAPNLSLQSDSGSSPTDGVTNVATINVNGLEAGATWEYQVDSGVWTKGTGSSFAATSGTHTYAVRQSDAAGNLGTASAVTSITLDTTGPALSMNLRTDSGSSTDFVTNDPVVMVNNLEAGRPWQYSLDGGTTWLDGYGNSFTLNNLLTNGDFSAGNTGFTSESAYFNVGTSTIPVWYMGVKGGVGGAGDNFLAVSGDPDATKTGWAQDVSLVKGVNYTFSYYAATNSPAAQLQVYVGGVAVGTATQLVSGADWALVTVSFTATTTGTQQLAIKDLVTVASGNDYALDGMSLSVDATYAANMIKVRQSDVAGNETIIGNAQTWTIDTTPPVAPSTAPSSYKDDIGSIQNASSTAAVTDDTLPGLNVGKALTDTPNLYVDGVKVTAIYDATNGTLTPVTPLSSGLHTFAYSLTDKAGNESGQSPTMSITIDTTAPNTPAVVVATDDVGTITGTITAGSTTDDTKPTFSGTGTAGDLIKIYDGATVIGSVTVATGGTWSFTPTTALPEGSHPITTTATDPSGNQSAKSAALTFTVDTTAPMAPGLSLQSDSGSSPTDGVTNVATINVNGLEAGATWEYQVDSGVWTKGTGSSFAATSGTHTYAVRQSDAAGNLGTASAATSITLDTTGPALSMNLRTDSGSSTDFVTNDPVVMVNNLEAGRPWQYSLDGGTTWLEGYGNSFTLNNLLSYGDFSTGVASYYSESSAAVMVAPPVGWGMGIKGGLGGIGDKFLMVDGASDATKYGWAQSVNLVQGANYTFSYYAATNAVPAKLQVYVGGVALGATTQLVSGADWALVTVSFQATTTGAQVLGIKDLVTTIASNDYALDGMSLSMDATFAANQVKVRQSDLAGNQSITSAGAITLDITPPTSPTAAPGSYNDNVGAIQNANSTAAVTDDTQPGINVGKALTDTPSLYVNGAKVAATYDSANGTLTPVTPLANGQYNFAYSLTDKAGNESAPSPARSITIDTTAPAAPTTAPTSYKDDVGAITNAASTANVTDDNKPGINITKLLTDTVNLYVDGVKTPSVYDAAAGTLTPLGAVADGAHTFAYSLSDVAGNESAQSGKLSITIDTAATSNATVGLGLSLLGDANNDGWVNASEMGTATTLTSRATFNASAKAGDMIRFKATNNGVALPDQTLILTATDITNKYVNVSFAKPAEGTVQAVTAAYMDAVGNVATDAAPSDSAKLDTVAPGAPAIHGMILSSQYSEAAVPMYVSLPSNAVAGDKINVTMTNTDISTLAKTTPYTTTLTVLAADLVAGQIGFSVPGTYFSKLATTQFSADIVDAAGNLGVKGYAAPAAPTINAANVDNDVVAFFETNAQIMPDATRAAKAAYADLYDYATIDTTLKFQGNVNANETVYLYDNGVQIGKATNASISDQGLQSWSYSGTFAVGEHKITAKSVSATGVSSDVSTLFTFTVQKDLPTVDFTNFTGTTYSAKNAVSERVTIMVDDVLTLPNALTVQGDVSDTVVLTGLHSELFNGYLDVLSGASSDYVKHVLGVNGQAGSWQFDLDGSGTMDLVVSDAIHRMILS